MQGAPTERTYSQIDLDERRRIARWRQAGVGVDAIAEKLGRHRSTIFSGPEIADQTVFLETDIRGLDPRDTTSASPLLGSFCS